MPTKNVRKILKQRDEVYFGSRMHFIRALWANALKENKFHIYLGDTTALYPDLVTAHDNQKFMRYNYFFSVNYKSQMSGLKQPQKGREILIAANGFNDPNVLWSGDMAMQRVGEMLPFEFEPLVKK